MAKELKMAMNKEEVKKQGLALISKIEKRTSEAN